MELCDDVVEINKEKIQHFVDCLKNSNWMLTATEETIDSLISTAVELEESFLNKENVNEYLVQTYPQVNFEKSGKILMRELIKSQKLNEHLTLYSMRKYTMLFSKNELCDLIDGLLAEANLQEHLYQMIEDEPNVDLDWFSMNNIIEEVSDEPSSHKVFNALKTQTSVLLNGIRYSSSLKGMDIIDKVINCLECQPDLRLWFLVFKPENLETVLDVCAKYNNFLQAVLRFFDKFADEVESNYDEDLNVKYCHLNLDFEDFLKVIQSFLNDKNMYKTINDYLEKKIQLTDKNFCFWIDVKACI